MVNNDPVVKQDQAAAHSGSVAIRCTPIAYVSQAVPVAPGKDYVLGHFTRSDQEHAAAHLQVTFLDAAGTMIDLKVKVAPVEKPWAWNEFVVTSPKYAALAVVYLAPHSGELWFDDAWFGEGTIAPRQ